MAPSLAAFGGWEEADWFNPALLSDTEVVAFELPRLPGVRRQGFSVVDRLLTRKPTGGAAQGQARPPRRVAGKLAVLLDAAGAVRATASCRSRLLFESDAVLFFADIPSAKLKQRAANKLRRDLVAIGMRACVLRAAADVTTLMFWPSAEPDITAFVFAAAPVHRLHPEFDAEPPSPPRRPTVTGGTDRAAPRQDSRREAELLRQIAALQDEVAALSRAQSAAGAMAQLGLDDARLKSMLKLLHPDKHGNSEAATEAAKWINAMRDLLKAQAGGGR